jgi:hypothetical protein
VRGTRSSLCAALSLLAISVAARAGDGACVACAGDCDADRQVAVSELIRAVRIAVGAETAAACPAADADRDGTVTITDLTRAVGRSLDGCLPQSTACDCREGAECATGVCANGFCCDVRCPVGRCDFRGLEGMCVGLLTLGSRCLEDLECQSEICDKREKICCDLECTDSATCFPSGHCRIR